MIFKPTSEQSEIIEAGPGPQCVVACPGSGKTATAVRRLVELRKSLKDSRGYATLLSYSNVAVDTFRAEYDKLARITPGLSPRVVIETVDSFLATFVLRPHGARTMGAPRQPFLVNGAEPFLARYKLAVKGGYPRGVDEVRVQFDGSMKEIWTAQGSVGPPTPLDADVAKALVERLGKVGAYTHDLGRYWVLLTLAESERLLRALCRRFPHVLVDEAQDVGHLHGLLLSALAEGGSSISLIGDPNQGIYDFAGADGSFLRNYARAPGVRLYPLSVNRRSLKPIVDLANALAKTESTHIREPGMRRCGVFYLLYDEDEPDKLLAAFSDILRANQYSDQDAVVICRGKAVVEGLTGGSAGEGVGATSHFVRAAILRDRNGDLAWAFESAASGLLKLLDAPPERLRDELLDISSIGEVKILRRLLWRFLRNADTGIPSAALPGSTKWQPLLKERLESWLSVVEKQTPFRRTPTWARNVTVKKLADQPMWQEDLAGAPGVKVRVDTVHQVKGEGFPVVMYVVRTADLRRLLEGTISEEGRIGYVAVTRTMDLLLVAVPNTTAKELIRELEERGVSLWG